MKVEKREIAQPKPPCEIVVTMSEKEAKELRFACMDYGETKNIDRAIENFNELKDTKGYNANILNNFGKMLRDAL